MTQEQIKHLEFIQDVIKRMASNSFLLKGWAITLVSALFVLADKQAKPQFFYIAYIPTLVFWILDGYYLALERKFRSLYAATIQQGSNVPLMSLDIRQYTGWHHKRNWWIVGILRPATSFFYGSMIIAMILVMNSLFH
jgi:hypothetical protein